MNQRIRLTIGLMFVAIMTACSPSQPPAEPEVVAQPAEDMPASLPAAEPPMPAPIAPASDTTSGSMASGSMIVYACNDGSGVTVTYDKYSALVKLPTGSTMLSRAESVSKGGDEAYLSEELSLYRNGNLVQLEGAGKSRTCTNSLASRDRLHAD
jgi:hypothetical protein